MELQQEAELPASSLPILPLFALSEGDAKGAAGCAVEAGGLLQLQSTPEEQSARTGHDMGAKIPFPPYPPRLQASRGL